MYDEFETEAALDAISDAAQMLEDEALANGYGSYEEMVAAEAARFEDMSLAGGW